MRNHAYERMFERFGIVYSTEIFNRIAGQIRKAQSRFVEKQSNARTVHEVEIDGKKLYVVWDKVHSHVITVLPPKRKWSQAD